MPAPPDESGRVPPEPARERQAWDVEQREARKNPKTDANEGPVHDGV